MSSGGHGDGVGNTNVVPPPPSAASGSSGNVTAAAAEASRLMPPPSAVNVGTSTTSSTSSTPSSSSKAQRAGGPGRGGRGARGRGRGRGKRGPGRPPNSERQGPSSSRSSSGSGATAGRSEVRRGPGRPPGKRKKQQQAAAAAAAAEEAVKPKRKYTKRKPADDDEDDDKHSAAAMSVDTSTAAASTMEYVTDSHSWSPHRPSGYETDPETALDVAEHKVSTIHWDPTEGSKVGWKVRLLSGPTVQDGRITQYDPYSHKHKIELDIDEENCFEDVNLASSSASSHGNNSQKGKKRKHKKATVLWVRLQQEDVQIATRLVWAHVKGYAWWPAMVMELTAGHNSSMAMPRDGYVNLAFIGAPEVATLRDAPDCIRPFSSLVADPVIEKSKKKRNAKAIAQAQREEVQLQTYKNMAARHYARKAFAMAASEKNNKYVGKRIRLFSSDINYPDGATVIGVVRQYSAHQKKWLVAYELNFKVKHKTSAAWINLNAKDCSVTTLKPPKQSNSSDDNAKPNRSSSKKDAIVDPTDMDLIPFLFGFEYKVTEKPIMASGKKGGKNKKGEDASTSTEATTDDATTPASQDALLAESLKERCKACVDVWSGDYTVTCVDCHGTYHLGCVDPPISTETYQRLIKEGKGKVVGWKCSRCTLCLGCYQKDIVFGSHPLVPIPPTVSLPQGETLNLCSMCVKAYEANKYCPNCAHSWDDVKYQKVLDRLDEEGVGPPEEPAPPTKKTKRKSDDEDDTGAADAATMVAKGMPSDTPFSNGKLMNGARVDTSWYHAENNVWGYTEGDMLVCDACDLWVHAGCGGLSKDEYEMTSEGKHPIYSKEFLCRVCCRRRCVDIIERLQREDIMMLFAVPVTEKVAPNYRDIIKHPMDLQTMMRKAKNEEYLNYAWVREDFALMVYNAVTFNRFYTKFWDEAKRFYEESIKVVFSPKMLAKAAPSCKYDELIQRNFLDAEAARQMEEERVQEDKSTEKKDLVAGAEVAKVTLPPLRQKPPDENSCLPFQELKVKPVDAFYFAWMDCCFTCGSSGAADTMIFCVDCGEAFHSFCANVPIHSMDADAVAGWRCPNCKVCEISGDVPVDELRMLFCEMCDRAYSLDLLDPPLRKAPSGLWICGQCVDCKVCNNTSEPQRPTKQKGLATSTISLKYWSKDPEKCYRCGGCDGMADLIVGDKLECQVCKKVMRSDDGNFIKCNDCKARVHLECDKRADEFVQRQKAEEMFGTRTVKAQQKARAKYKCPSCAGIKIAPTPKMDYTTVDTAQKTNLHAQAWQTIVQGGLKCDNYSPLELHGKLLDQLDWQTREMWRDEYVGVVNEAMQYYDLVKSSYSDPRKTVQGIAKGNIDLPGWIGERASRFLVLAKRSKWGATGFSPKKIESCVFAAKLAAAFLAVACHVLDVDMRQKLKSFNRVERLLKAPLTQGVFEIPADKVRNQGKTDNAEAREGSQQVANSQANGAAAQCVVASTNIIAEPLCGWGRHVDPSSTDNAWRDPRECCLCHLCGDDDAGFPPADEVNANKAGASTESENNASDAPPPLDKPPKFAKLGRLLPMSDGQWVHASCALWSSEVWESPRGGLINAMEKARSRGAQLKCFGCGRAGATVGCNKPNCSFNYHFPCAKACGSIFTSKQQMFCVNHRDTHNSGGTIIRESYEAMKTLIVAPEKQKQPAPGSADKDSGDNNEFCIRVGSLVVHALGTIVTDVDGHHTDDYIYPEGYVATRIFWSMVSPKTRTVYVLKIERNASSDGSTGALFSITPGDAPSSKIRGRFASQVYKTLVDRVRKVNADYFSHGDLFSKLPMIRRSRKRFFALNGPQFFGYGLNLVRERLENMPGVEAVTAPLKPTSPRYRFCFLQPNIDTIMDLQRKRAAVAAERALENSSGCARTEGRVAVARSGGSGRITRALVRSVVEESPEEVGGSSTGGNRRKNTDSEKNKLDKKKHQAKYNKMKSVPIENRLVARRSHIHGWGLFTKLDIKKDDMIVEYQGEIVRNCISDKREAAYEISGEGSCYMFRLDFDRVVDATMIGCMARFMNHCCQPNAYAKIITVDTEGVGVDKKIAVLAHRDIAAGEEITYDYKFPVEDGSLRCTCGAPNCIGRMN